MQQFPLYLPVGMIAVYGVGSLAQTPQGVINPPGVRWGTVYNVWDGGRVFVYNGDTVSFRDSDVVARLAIGSGTYTLLPCRLVTKEIPVL